MGTWTWDGLGLMPRVIVCAAVSALCPRMHACMHVGTCQSDLIQSASMMLSDAQVSHDWLLLLPRARMHLQGQLWMCLALPAKG